MEWSANGKFEDRASLVFLNRRLPVPKFEKSSTDANKTLMIATDGLKLIYTPTRASAGRPGFTAENLEVTLTLGPKKVTWHPGQADPDNLLGTAHSLDGANGTELRDPIEPGLVSRSGWAFVDDTTRPLFDSTDFTFRDGEKSPWPWATERPPQEKPGAYTDWYSATVMIIARRWAITSASPAASRCRRAMPSARGGRAGGMMADQEIYDLIKGFRDSDVPLDVIDLDTAWHVSAAQFQPLGEVDQSKQNDPVGWTGYTWESLFFSDPDQFLKRLHEDGLKLTLILHTAAGIEPWKKPIRKWRAPWASIPRPANIFPSTRPTRNLPPITWT